MHIDSVKYELCTGAPVILRWSVLSRLCGLCRRRRRRMSLGESGEQVRRGGESLQENNFELEAKGERRLVVSDGSVR